MIAIVRDPPAFFPSSASYVQQILYWNRQRRDALLEQFAKLPKRRIWQGRKSSEV